MRGHGDCQQLMRDMLKVETYVHFSLLVSQVDMLLLHENKTIFNATLLQAFFNL